jgi:hypothetical protein
VRRVLLALVIAGLLIAGTASPALAFHHSFLPGGPCGHSEVSGGDNPTAIGAINEHNTVQGGSNLPLPPTGTPAVEHSDQITSPPTAATCPAPQK